MPRIDPQQLLTCLTPLLAQNGGIKSAGEVIRLANLMEKYSKKLVSKCIYIQILKCTETDLLGQFMAAGGWNLVHNWLDDGVASNNWAFIQELLEMLLLCPVDGNRLKSNHTPKTVKNLSISCEQQTVKILSSKLVEQWLRIAHQEKQQLAASQSNGSEENSQPEIKAEKPQENGMEKPVEAKSEDESVKKSSSENVKYKVNNKEGSGKLLLTLKRSTSPSIDEKDSKISRTSNESKSKSSKSSSSSDKDKEKEKKSSSSSSSSSSHRSSSKSSHRDKDKERSSSHHKSSSRDKDKDKHSSSSSRSSSSKSSSSRDKDRKKESHDKDKDKEKEKEKSQAEKDKETLDFLTPMPSAKLQRIPKRQHSENSENKSSESNDASPGSKVEKKKPSISIEVRKGDKPKTVKTLNSQFRNHGLAEEPPKPPSRKDLKKPTTTAAPVALPVAAPVVVKPSTSPPPVKKIHLDTSNVPEREGGAKLIKPKPMIMESIGFMDALSASAVTKKDPKKRKRLPSNSTAKKDEPESPKIDAKPLKFYKDTLEENEEEATNGEKSPTKEVEAVTSEETKEESPEKTEKSEEVKTEKSPEKEEVPEEKRKPGIGCGPDGPPGVLVDPNMPRRKKRPIRWRSEEDLTEIRYFELDENERVNVTKTFTEQKQIEHGEERSAFKLGQRLATEDTMVEQTKWRPLIPIDNTLQFDYGSKSREVLIQAEREKNVLQELYLGASFIETPKEPDHESYEHIEPQTIPLEDVTGNPDSVTNFTDIPWPTPKGELPSTFSSNAFANVFSGVNIPSGIGIPPAVGIANPLVAFANPPNPMIAAPWLQPPFMQPPPNIMPQGPPGFNRGGMNHNNHNNNNNFRGNNRPYNNNSGGGGGNWVRGNQRRGICNQFQRTGVCRNKSCPYIHER